MRALLLLLITLSTSLLADSTITINVSESNGMGRFTVEYGTRISLSSGTIMELDMQDRTLVTKESDLLNKTGLLSFVDTISTVSYVKEPKEIDTIPVYIDTFDYDKWDFVSDTFAIYPSIKAYEIAKWPDQFWGTHDSGRVISIAVEGSHTVRLKMFCGRENASFSWETDHMGNGKFLSDSKIDVSTPYDSGTIELSRNRVYLSNDAILKFCFADQTPYTGIGLNGDRFLSFLNPSNKVTFSNNTPLDTTLFFTKGSDGDDIDTIGIYPAFPVINYVKIGELIAFPAEGFDREFYLTKFGHHTVRCHIDSSNLYEVKWESDSMGNGLFPSEICDTVTETVYDTFSVWGCINYPSRPVPNIDYEYNGIRLLHDFDFDENEEIKYLRITKGNELDKFLAEVYVDSNRIFYEYRVYEHIEQFRDNKEELEDSFTYTVYTHNSKTKENKKYDVHNHVIFYLTHVHNLTELSKKESLNTKLHDEIAIYSISGRLIQSYKNSPLSKIDTQSLSTGYYILSYTLNDKIIQKKLFVK